jgi:hypothetical protein
MLKLTDPLLTRAESKAISVFRLNQLLTTSLSENYDTANHNQLMLWDL